MERVFLSAPGRSAVSAKALTALNRLGARVRPSGGETLLWFFFLALPFLMFSWMVPFVTSRTFGNDYSVWGLQAQLEVFWSAKSGTLPLYMPGFTIGHSTAAMTLAELYHPQAWLTALMPGYWDGKAVEWTTFYRFISLGVAHAGLYKLCRRMSLTRLTAFCATFPAVYNLRMLDSFRYGPSLEGYTAMLMIVAVCGFIYLQPASKRFVPLLAICTYFLIVCGHPQWAYLGGLAAGMFAVAFPWIAGALSHRAPTPDVKRMARYLRQLFIGFGAGALFSMPYILTFYFEVMKTNHTRAESSYEWTLQYGDSLAGELCNFVNPFHADVHGAFAGSAWFLIAALIPLLLLARERMPKVLWLLYGVLVVAFVFSAGSDGPAKGALHRFIVHHIPGFGVFRVPGRIVIWIPTLAWPLWAWLLRPGNRRALFVVAIGGLVVLTSKWLWGEAALIHSEYTTPHTIFGKGFPPNLDRAVFYVMGATLVVLAVASTYRRASRYLVPVAICLMALSTRLCIEHGTWKSGRIATPTFNSMAAYRKTSPSARDVAGDGLEVRGHTEYISRGISAVRPFGMLVHHANQLTNKEDFWAALKAAKNTPLYLDSIPTPIGSEVVSDRDYVKLVHNTSNRFEFDVFAARDGYFVLGLPWLSGFRGQVDGVDSPVSQANELFPAMFVPHGTHRVSFRFVSRPFMAGLAISFLTAWLWLIWGLRSRLRTTLRRSAVAGLFVLSAAGVFFGFRAWLYQGPSFGTKFDWQAAVERPTSN